MTIDTKPKQTKQISSPSGGSTTSSSNQLMHYTLVLLRVSGGLLVVAYVVFTLFVNNPYSPSHHSAVKRNSGYYSSKNSDIALKLSKLPNNRTTNNDNNHLVQPPPPPPPPSTSVQTKAVAKVKINYENIDLVLPKFPTLQKALDRSDVVALYFGASWCKQSKTVTGLIDAILGPVIDTKQQNERASQRQQQQQQQQQRRRRPLELVYVSSDANSKQMQSFLKRKHHSLWSNVPYQSTASKERQGLKRYFKVCAKREMGPLKLERKHDIPFLVILDGKTHKIVSHTGVQDLKQQGMGVLQYWTSLLTPTTQLDSTTTTTTTASGQNNVVDSNEIQARESK